MRSVVVTLAFIFVVGDFTIAQAKGASNSRIAVCHKQADVCAQLLIRGDYAAFIPRCNLAKVIELSGGRAEMMKMMAEGRKKMRAEGADFQSATVSPPAEIITHKGTSYAIVPTEMVLKLEDGVVHNESFLLGVSVDAGKSWRFLDGGGLNEEALKAVLPDLPASVKLPPRKEPRMEHKH